MKLTRSFSYVRRILAPGELSRTLKLVLERVGIDPLNSTFSITEKLADGTTSTSRGTLKDTDPICDPGLRSVSFYNPGDLTFYLAVSAQSDDVYTLHLETEGAEHLEIARQTFEESLHLDAPPPVDQNAGNSRIAEALATFVNASLSPLQERIEKLEVAVLSRSRQLRCFLSYRFNDANEITALRLQQFLSILNVEVLTGANYEPRQVSEKVLSKLREPLDFVVILITSAGESMWTRDEVGAAIHKGLALVPLVEKGTKFEPGLFADIEHVEYEAGHVGDSFLKLAQAVRFIREQKVNNDTAAELPANSA